MGRLTGRRRSGRLPAGHASSLAIAASAAFLAGCGLVGGPGTFHPDVPETMTVTSPDVEHGTIAPDFTCHGAGKAPGLHWSGAPPQRTKSYAVVVDDSDAPIRPYIYWILFDINPQQTVIQPGQIPQSARQAQNSQGTVGYDPPCPVNAGHRYRFTVYALDSKLKLSSGVNVKTAWTQIAQAAIARGRLYAVGKP